MLMSCRALAGKGATRAGCPLEILGMGRLPGRSTHGRQNVSMLRKRAGMCWGASEVYLCDARAPAAGRQFCIQQLSAALTEAPGRDDLVYDATVVVSELLTNSIRAGGSVARLSLALHRDLLRVTVDDDATGLPRIRAAESAATSGRGMAIVASLASKWSVERLIPGKQVWAELDLPPELTADLPSCHRPMRFHPSVDTNSVELGMPLAADAGTSESPASLPPGDSWRSTLR
jgi:anti-sigma regulatory factor (Ser/Thr protein kinase)